MRLRALRPRPFVSYLDHRLLQQTQKRREARKRGRSQRDTRIARANTVPCARARAGSVPVPDRPESPKTRTRGARGIHPAILRTEQAGIWVLCTEIVAKVCRTGAR